MRRDRTPRREQRLMVRAPGDIWSDEFRDELHRDRHFEASLLLREAVVLPIVLLVLLLHLVA